MLVYFLAGKKRTITATSKGLEVARGNGPGDKVILINEKLATNPEESQR